MYGSLNINCCMIVILNIFVTENLSLKMCVSCYISRKNNTRGVQKVLEIDIQKIHKALEFDLI